MFFFRQKEKQNNTQNNAQINIAQVLEVEGLPIYSRRPDPFQLSLIPKATKGNAGILLSIVKESADQVNRTLLPVAFFENWNIMFYTLKKLINLEGQVRFQGTPPHVLLQQCKAKYEASTFDFLNRYAAYHWREKIQSLKTERGKLNRNEKFLDDILPHWKDMTQNSQMKAWELKEAEKSMILAQDKK